MSTSITHEIATRLINFVTSTLVSKKVTLSPDDLRVLYDILEITGFKNTRLVPGRLTDTICIIEGTQRPEEINTTINPFFSYRVLSKHEHESDEFDNEEATKLLDYLIQTIHSAYGENKQTPERLLPMVIVLIERHIPLKPIPLPPNNGTLIEDPMVQGIKNALTDFLGTFFRRPFKRIGDEDPIITLVSDDEQLNSLVGFHVPCGGQMRYVNETPTKGTIVCYKCTLNVSFCTIPDVVPTYGYLRQVFAQQLSVPK